MIRRHLRRVLIGAAVPCFLLASLACADTLRIASYHTGMSRKGPGLLLRDIQKGNDPQIAAVVAVISRVRPDILALQDIDWDYDTLALRAFADQLRDAGQDYPYLYSARPNTGWDTGLDMDGDGRTGRASDAQGFGAFTGQGGMAVLSRFPIDPDQVQDFSDLLWADLPGALLPVTKTGGPFPSAQALAVQRLSNTGHWAVPIRLPDGQVFTLLTYHASPPVFDGPEDRNGRRNHDETRFWRLFLDGTIGQAPDRLFALAGSAALDPYDSEGRRGAIAVLLRDSRLQDTKPTSPGGAAAPDQGHRGANALDTADWPAPGPGRLRVDYVLPSADLTVIASGVFWPQPGTADHDVAVSASRHRLVWVDVSVPPAP